MVGSVSLLIERQAMRLPEGTMTVPFSCTTSSSTTALTGPGFFGSIGEASRAMIRESLGSDSATTGGRSRIGVGFDVGAATVVFFRGRTIGRTTASVTRGGVGEALVGRTGWSAWAFGSDGCSEDFASGVSGAL